MAFGKRKFKFRVQYRPASKLKGQRLTLVAQKKIVQVNKLKGVAERAPVKQVGSVAIDPLKKKALRLKSGHNVKVPR